MRKVIALLVGTGAMLLAGLAASVSGADEPVSQSGQVTAAQVEPRANLADIEEQVMCPVCGTLLGLSEAPAADRQRVFIRRLIARGFDQDQIEDALVAEYGPQVLALPDDEGINAWAYLVPLIGLIGGAVGVGAAVVLWRRRTALESEPTPARMPQGEAAERLDRDLDRFDG